MCGREVERYRAQVQRYLECLDVERITANRKANEVVERFNCKLRGGGLCP